MKKQRGSTGVGTWVFLCCAIGIHTQAMAEHSPQITVAKDGTVTGEILIDAPTKVIQDILNDTTGEFTKLTEDVFTVSASGKGFCEEVTRTTRGFLHPFSFRTLRCPTSRGFEEHLIESSDFRIYQTRWDLEEGQGGTRITYSVKTEFYSPMPKAIVRKNIVRSVTDAIDNLVLKVFPKKKIR